MEAAHQRTDPLRLISAILLGGIVGVIVFLIVAMAIGVINDHLHMAIPVNLLIAENVVSAFLMAVFIIIGIAYFVRKVMTTPQSNPPLLTDDGMDD